MTADTIDYGGGRSLPVHATVDDPTADLETGLLIRMHVALLGMREGQILRISSPSGQLTDQLRSFEAASTHALLAVGPDPERPGWTAHYLRKGRARTDWTETPDALPGAAARPQSADELMPTRLWMYTNFDCNLSCDYCCVVSGPRADPRRLPAERIRSLVDEATASGLDRVFLTGGEPTLRPDLPELIEYVTDRLPLTLLTNAMLLRGPRWDRLRPLIDIGRPIAFQVSLDSATAERHDTHRGRGAHAGALAGSAPWWTPGRAFGWRHRSRRKPSARSRSSIDWRTRSASNPWTGSSVRSRSGEPPPRANPSAPRISPRS